ncbi:transcription factor WhiB [Kribbella antiqua]|uniref:Transcription factor WhiB n=1 Tax=Kribbella antiqua TaxID=2512217 RepID=A0A4R2II17_9ACTN|nr:transcription factor WhiB [Kribbella antiqua]
MVCRQCEVADACLDWAVRTGQDAGVWGGLSEVERRALKHGRRVMDQSESPTGGGNAEGAAADREHGERVSNG